MLVTGGAGFIGSNIVDKLVELGYQVVVLDNLTTGKKEYVHPLANFYNIDIRDKGIDEIFALERPDYVVHHAAQIDVQTSVKQPVVDADVNILGSINLVQCGTRYGVNKFIYASSAAVYGEPRYLGVDEMHPVEPISFYGISKHTLEHYLQTFARLYGLKFTILRYANAYGIRQDPKGEGGVISIFLDRLLHNQFPFIFGDGEQTRDFIYVKDIVAANIAALHKGDNEIINISCNNAITVNALLKTMNTLMGTNIAPVYKEERPGDIRHSYLTNTKAEQLLGWQPAYDLIRGLEETIRFYS